MDVGTSDFLTLGGMVIGLQRCVLCGQVPVLTEKRLVQASPPVVGDLKGASINY